MTFVPTSRVFSAAPFAVFALTVLCQIGIGGGFSSSYPSMGCMASRSQPAAARRRRRDVISPSLLWRPLFSFAQSSTTVAPNATSASGIVITSSTAIASSSPAPTPSSTGGASTDEVLMNVIFTSFAQDLQFEYRRVMSTTLNQTINRIQFDVDAVSDDVRSYPFGFNVLVRVKVFPPQSTDVKQDAADIVAAYLFEAANAPATSALRTSDFNDIGIVEAHMVRSLSVYQYSVLTPWDVLYSLLIVAGGLGFLVFFIFMCVKVFLNRRHDLREREQEEAQKQREDAAKEAQEKLDKMAFGSQASQVTSSTKKAADGGDAAESAAIARLKELTVDDDAKLDPDEERLMMALMAKLKAQRQHGGGHLLGGSESMSAIVAPTSLDSYRTPQRENAGGGSGCGPALLTIPEEERNLYPDAVAASGVGAGGFGPRSQVPTESRFTAPSMRPAFTESSGPPRQPVAPDVTQSAVHAYIQGIALPPMSSDDDHLL